jgi:CRP-like cAMP-binding protein
VATVDPSQEQLVRLLAGVDLFADLPDGDLLRLAEATHGAVVPGGKMIFDEGEPGDSFYIVYSGSVEILKTGPEGIAERLAVKREGEGFGEMALLNDAPRSAGARAAEDTELIVLPQEAFLALVGHEPLALRLLQSFSKALRALNVRFAALERTIRISTDDDPYRVSREIRQGMLPRELPTIAGYDVAGGTAAEPDGRGQTAWDVVETPLGTVLALMEVRQEGLPPAHLLGLARTALRAAAPGAPSLQALLASANDAVAGSLPEEVEQSVDCALLLPGADTLRWSCAGQLQGAVLRRDGSVHPLRSHGPDLGVMEGFSYGEEEVPLGNGDAVLALSVESQGLFRGATDLVGQLHGTAGGQVVSLVHKALRKAQAPDVRDVSAVYLRRH